MSKLIRLSPTGIEYGDYTWNFISGCDNNINGKCKAGGFRCWAYSICQRFADHYPNGFKPTIYPKALLSPLYLKKPSRILCAFMGDLFWGCPEFNPERKIEATLPSQIGSIEMSFRGWLFTTIKQCPQHTFLFLTKQPQNLPQWGPFPDNCWMGVTATDAIMTFRAEDVLAHIEAKVKYISFEPLLSRIENPEGLLATLVRHIDWLIIGAQTKPYKSPKIEWIEEIVKAADKADIPVFLKNNLRPLLATNLYKVKVWASRNGELRQEMPK